jgi:hypothetical protein
MVYFLLVASGCASGTNASTSREPRGRRDLITEAEIQRAAASNAYDLVSGLRPHWLTTRGPDSILGPSSEIQVVLDGVKIGPVRDLRSLSPVGMVLLQFVDGPTASGRWGLGFGMGAIVITTQR